MDQHADFLKKFLQCEADLRAFVGAIVRDVHAREDLLQEIALTLWECFGRYDPCRPFAAWARGIAAKKLLERWHQGRRTPVPFSPEAVGRLAEAAERIASRPSPGFDALEHCLDKLPEKSRRLLALRYSREEPVEAIAGEFRVGCDAIYQALSRLRRRLRECMTRYLAGQGET
jgi:RNA polymerase sigma-70 factor (ECF subfamily)